jgi:hypothetical protein
MRDLTKAAFSYTWAMSLFGVQQVANLLAPSELGEPARRANAAFYSVTQATEEQFGDLVWAAYQVGDDLQRSTVNLFFDILTLRALTPAYAAQFAETVARQSAETLRTFTSGENLNLALQEFRNNYEVYNLVKHVHDRLHIPSRGEFPLDQLVERAYALGAYPDLWAIEGLGHDYAQTFLERGLPVRNILTDERASVLPAKSLTMMHAGIGLAFAQRLMKRLTPYSVGAEIRGVLRDFIERCQENSRRGYVGAAYESLGLVTRTWHAQMVQVIDRQLSEMEPEVQSYFWHGAGRALYFLPIYFVPGLLSPWRAAEQEPPHELGRRNMLAGLAWAMTLVNMRQPAIMENLLRYQGERLSRSDAFVNGVMSALIMGHDITPDDPFIKGFCRYRPDASEPALDERWTRMVAQPCQEALEHIYPLLREHERLGDLFHYRNLRELAEQLRQEHGAGALSCGG